jgi:hypothetical protein
LSGLVLERTTAARLAGVEAVADLPVVPTVARVFVPTNHVTAFLRVYQGGKDALAPVRLTCRIVNDLNESAFESESRLEAAGSDARRARRLSDRLAARASPRR